MTTFAKVRVGMLSLIALSFGLIPGLIVLAGPASASADHRANLSFELSGHLIASGEVKIPDGHNKCAGDRRVAIERKVSGHWKTLRHDQTGHRGLYRVTLPDASGTYRAEVGKKRLAHGLCLADTSRTRSYTKPSGGGGGGGGGGSCTPGYNPCLIYHGGADYDCYGGGGNGPYYTAPGVTYRVSGSDPYGLDADNDGLGCE